jgi:hypothetical protein
LGNTEAETSQRILAGSDCKIAMHRLLRSGPVVRAPAAAGSCTGPQRFVDDGLDRARAPAALRAATEAAIKLLGVTREIIRRADGASNIVVGKDVAGTNNHEKQKRLR